MDKKYRYGEVRNCVICGASFAPRDKGSVQQCCSNACRGALQTRKAERSCAVCGKTFTPSRPGYETCSRKCGTALRLSRRTIDPMVKVRKRLAVFCCSAIARCLRNKTDRTAALLGYSVDELRAHIEAHFAPKMSWENYGKGMDQWSIDHSRPISSFPLTATLAEINSMKNLRPMWHRENCSKRNKWNAQ
jgi:hypothetical protein